MKLCLKSGNKVHILGVDASGDWRTICGRPDDGEWVWDIPDESPRSAMPEPLCRRCDAVAFLESADRIHDELRRLTEPQGKGPRDGGFRPGPEFEAPLILDPEETQ
jgi:hypothetical protein